MAKKEKKYLVKTPNTHFNGVRLGVVFKEGEGRADKETATKLAKRWGYSCPELFPDDEKDKEPGTSDDEKDKEPETSTDIKGWQHAVSAVQQLTSAEDVKAFVKGDDRDSVKKAAKERIEELSE